MRGKSSRGEISGEKTFRQAVDQFTHKYEVMTEGERNAKYVQDHQSRLRNHLPTYFGKMGLSEITAGAVQDYRIFRLQNDENYKPPSRSTMHHEIVTLRQVLKTALRHGWLAGLPDFSTPYRASSKVSHRAWFSPDEYKQLYEATRQNARYTKGITPRIPPRQGRNHPAGYSKTLYKQRHKDENMFGSLKDWRRVATRYDRCANTFFSAICIVAIVIWWT